MTRKEVLRRKENKIDFPSLPRFTFGWNVTQADMNRRGQ